MPPDVLRYLVDLQSASNRILQYTDGMAFEDYVVDLRTRDAVERCFEIIGEALRQALKHYPHLATSFPDSSDIIGLRNILIHQYGEVDDALIWALVENSVAEFLVRVEAAMKVYEKPE